MIAFPFLRIRNIHGLHQFSYIATIATLTISARLRRFDRTSEEAALNLGASKAAVFGTILLPYPRPAREKPVE